MHRSYNFSAGPAMLPEEVLLQAQKEFLNWRDGISILEDSHRTPCFAELVEKLRQQFHEILNIPQNYKVLFMQAGGTAQFAAVPLNLLQEKTTADYIDTGFWSERAIVEAKLYCDVNIAASNVEQHYTDIPNVKTWNLNPNAAYVHYVTNETIHGIEFPFVPDTGNVPLVADMSSNILSKAIDVSQYGIIYAGAQKNIGPPGMTLVIIREDLLGYARQITPAILDYNRYAAEGFYNTPNTFAIYLAHLCLTWLQKQGGVEAIEKINQHKAKLLYDAIDNSNGFYINKVKSPFRSNMNVPYSIVNPELEKIFIVEAKKVGLLNLSGHKSAGGLRASIYNAMPIAGVNALIEFMQTFKQQYR